MKRDARIGLAVVLVLGLLTTLLVAHALRNRAEKMEAEFNDPAAGQPLRHDGERSALSGQAPNPLARSDAPQGPASRTPSTPEARARELALRNFLSSHAGTGRPPARKASTNKKALPSRAEWVFDLPEEKSAPLRPAAPATASAKATLPPLLSHPASPAHPSRPVPSQVSPAKVKNASGWRYTVQAGDNPWRIALKVFGEGRWAAKILAANKDLDAQRLNVGQVIRIPALPGKKPLLALSSAAVQTARAAAPLHPDPAPRFAGGAVSHAVQAGDTLTAIAKRYYGASGPRSVQRILEANPGLDPLRLRIGMKVKVPARPAATP